MQTKSIIWVTGSNGFVGSTFCRYLLDSGYTVMGLVRELERSAELRHIEGLQISPTDVGDLEQLKSLAGESPPSAIVHCAASVGPELQEAETGNITSVKNLLRLAAFHPFHLIHVSTISVYDLSKGLQVDESASLYRNVMEENLYGTTKAMGDLLIQKAIGEDRVCATILRPGAIMGRHPRSSWSNRVPARLREKGSAAMPIPLDSPMPWLMIENFCHALDLCLSNPVARGSIYNLFDEVRLWRDYLLPIAAAAGFAVEDPQQAAKLDFPRFFAEKIRSDLGYLPRRTFASALQEVVKSIAETG